MKSVTRTSVVGLIALMTLVGGGHAAASASVRPGSVRVESDPAEATVYLDGRLAGQTPVTLAMIAPGVHRVLLARTGYLENSRLVTVKAGTLARVSAQLTASAPPLQIVVVEGEGAVNIIQQKTAVAPVIEVRDRNDQPVAGAVVRFAIQKGKASFNGARTLTATTDAFGRVTAAGLTPIGNGPLQIGATAAFQGQTAAITIAQTNVMTAAQASAVAAGGGTAGGGGGLSNLAIAGIVGGAGAGIGGVLLASKTSSEPSSETSSLSGGANSGSCAGSPFCGGWQVVFSPGLDVSACGVAAPGGLSSQTLNVNASGAFRDPWGNSLGTTGGIGTLEVAGSMTATGLTGTLRCFATPATGTITATPSGPDYLGSATLSGVTVTIRVNKTNR